MIRSEKVPTAVLETVFRQASNSRIITNAYSQYERALEELDSIGVKRINVMVDSDYQVKEEVRKARDRYIEMGAAAGFEMAPITWTQKQKGVDDLYKHLFRDK